MLTEKRTRIKMPPIINLAKTYNAEYLRDSKKIEAISVKKIYLHGNFSNIYFTRREVQCLRLFLVGLNQKDTAKELDLSPRTVNQYSISMQRKLQCRNHVALVQIAQEINILENLKAA